jgi:hypothetical protein
MGENARVATAMLTQNGLLFQGTSGAAGRSIFMPPQDVLPGAARPIPDRRATVSRIPCNHHQENTMTDMSEVSRAATTSKLKGRGPAAPTKTASEVGAASPEQWAEDYLDELADPDTDVELIGYMRDAKSGHFGPTLETFCAELQKRLVTLVQNHGLPAPGTESMSLAAEAAADSVSRTPSAIAFDEALLKLDEVSATLDLMAHQPIDADALHEHTLQTLTLVMGQRVHEAKRLLMSVAPQGEHHD